MPRQTKRSRRQRRSRSKTIRRSRFEDNCEQIFKDLKLEYTYEPESWPYTWTATYTPDWKFGNIYVETKGKLDYEQRKKLKCIKASNPSRDLRVMLMKDQPIRAGSTTFYSDWLEKEGFIWSVYPDLPFDPQEICYDDDEN